MQQYEIIEMAQEAGFILSNDGRNAPQVLRMMTKFAELVEEKATEEANARANASWTLMCKKMVEAEREAAEERVVDLFTDMETPYLPDIIKTIRARGESQ